MVDGTFLQRTELADGWDYVCSDSGECGWPKYDCVRSSTLHFDTEPRVVDDPLAVELALRKGVR